MKPGEHKTVQARILDHAEAEDALLGQYRHLHTNIYGRADHASDRWGSFFLDCFPVRDA
jgi:hypothetical protein